MQTNNGNIEEIYHKLRGQDPGRAIEYLFKAFYTDLVRAVFQYTREQALAEDIVQDVFHDFWKKHDQIDIQHSIFSYLKRAAINKTLNHFRDNRIKTIDWDDQYDTRSTASKPQKNLEVEELRIFLDKTINDLPERCRIIFLLSREEEMTYKEIASSLDISVKTVENQMSKALKRIRNALSDQWPNITFAFWITFYLNILQNWIGAPLFFCV